MKAFVRNILKCYIKRLEFRHSVQQAFLKHYSLIPVKDSKRISRKFVYEKIEEELRLDRWNARRHYFLDCLKEIGVVPTYSKGLRYFRGIIAN